MDVAVFFAQTRLITIRRISIHAPTNLDHCHSMMINDSTMKKHLLFGYILPCCMFVAMGIIVGVEFNDIQWKTQTPLSHAWTRFVISACFIGAAGFGTAMLIYLPYAIEIDDVGAFIFLMQSIVWMMFALLWYSELQNNPYGTSTSFREMIWFGRGASPPFDCCFFGAFFVPSWFIMTILGIIFWRQLSGTVKIANTLFIGMFCLLVLTYAFPPSP